MSLLLLLPPCGSFSLPGSCSSSHMDFYPHTSTTTAFTRPCLLHICFLSHFTAAARQFGVIGLSRSCIKKHQLCFGSSGQICISASSSSDKKLELDAKEKITKTKPTTSNGSAKAPETVAKRSSYYGKANGSRKMDRISASSKLGQVVDQVVGFLAPREKGDLRDVLLMSISFAVLVYISQRLVCAYCLLRHMSQGH